MLGGRGEGTKDRTLGLRLRHYSSGGPHLLQSCKRSISLNHHTLTSNSFLLPPITRFKLFSASNMSEPVEDQPGDVRSQSFSLFRPHDTPQAVPASQKSTWSQFIKSSVPSFSTPSSSHPLYSIATFSGDLYSLTAPPFILSPVSLTEFPGAPPHIYYGIKLVLTVRPCFVYSLLV